MPQSLPIYQLTEQNLIHIVWMEDAPTHTTEHPFCAGGDPECPCRDDRDLVREFITKPLDAGLLTNAEALRLYFGNQV